MAIVLEDIRKNLLERLGVADQKHTEATNEDSRVKELVTTLSGDVISKLVRDINQELEQNREEIRVIEIKSNELRKQLSAIRAHCQHPDYDVDSEGSMSIAVCKLCGHSETTDSSIAQFYR